MPKVAQAHTSDSRANLSESSSGDSGVFSLYQRAVKNDHKKIHTNIASHIHHTGAKTMRTPKDTVAMIAQYNERSSFGITPSKDDILFPCLNAANGNSPTAKTP